MKRIKRMLAFCLAIIMFVSACPISSFAATTDGSLEVVQDPTLEGNDYEQAIVVAQNEISDFTYKVLNGTFCEITGYTGTTSEVVIPGEIEGYIVQKISTNVFKENKTITSVIFPNTIESIEESLFSGCTSLENVQFYEGLTKIPNRTFEGCTALETIVMPESVTEIGEYAFVNCSALKNVTFSDNLKVIKGDRKSVV